MIVVDGRTDEEKLRELLAAGTEETALDFKSTLDLSRRTSKDSLEFIKDCIAMGNLPGGGYIVIGVDGRGRPAHDQPPVDVRQFDSADLRNRVAKYVDAPVHILSQHHEVDGTGRYLGGRPPYGYTLKDLGPHRTQRRPPTANASAG